MSCPKAKSKRSSNGKYRTVIVQDCCRICLRPAADNCQLISIKNPHPKNGGNDQITIYEKLVCCVAEVTLTDDVGDVGMVKETEGDEEFVLKMPMWMCTRCVDELCVAYEFRMRTLNSYTYLKQYLCEMSRDTVQILEQQPLINTTATNNNNNNNVIQPNCALNDLDLDPVTIIDQQLMETAQLMSTSPDLQLLDDLDQLLLINNNSDSCHTSQTTSPQQQQLVIYQCPDCTECFAQKTDLKQHYRTHTKAFRCLSCAQSFTKNSALKYHVMRTHAPKQFECTVCGKLFVHRSQLRQHVSLHSAHHPYKCQLCQRTFSRRTQLDRHIEEHRQQCMTHQCHICDKVFAQRVVLQRHLYTHTGIRPFQCVTCQHSFIDEHSLSVHERSAHAHKCLQCPARFPHQHELEKHQLLCHSLDDSLDVDQFQCELCSKAFVRMSQLREHVQRQHPECAICGKRFNYKLQLQLHQHTVHKNNVGKPFKCSQCGKLFSHEHYLDVHQSCAHPRASPAPSMCTTIGSNQNTVVNSSALNVVPVFNTGFVGQPTVQLIQPVQWTTKPANILYQFTNNNNNNNNNNNIGT